MEFENLNIKIAMSMIKICTIYYKKTGDIKADDAISKLRLMVNTGNTREALAPVLPEILKFANLRKDLLLKKDIFAFDGYKINIPDYEILIESAKKVYEISNEEEKKIFWRSINNIISYTSKLYC